MKNPWNIQEKLRKNFNAGAQGFSLVELSIALVVIGLLVGGALKGLELVESARLKTVLAQVKDFRIAVSTFMDRYEALPGDYGEASRYIKPGLVDGNHSGTIDGAGLDRTSEAVAFWTHLAAADLISSPGVLPSGGPARFGKGVPMAKIGGGFTIQYAPFPEMSGHWFILGEAQGINNDAGGLTPLQAFSLDKKADNGDPLSGKIRAKTGVNFLPHACVDAQGRYNVTETRKVCVVYFQL